MTISNFVAYVKQAWKNKPDTSTPLSAARLTHLEDGIKGNSDAIEKIAAAVVSQIVNDPNKIASMASLYSVNQAVTQLNSDLTAMVIGNKKITWNIYCVVTTDENGNCNIPFGYTFADTDICVIPMVAYSYEQCSASVRGVNTTGFSVSVNVAGQHWTNKEITLIWVAIGNK